MAESALSKLKKIFVTPQHDYKISTELFGQFDANKVAKELNLEKKGAAKGASSYITCFTRGALVAPVHAEGEKMSPLS